MLATLNTIVANSETHTEQHDAALHLCNEMHHQFDDGLNCDGFVALHISKQDLTRLFANPKTGKEVDP